MDPYMNSNQMTAKQKTLLWRVFALIVAALALIGLGSSRQLSVTVWGFVLAGMAVSVSAVATWLLAAAIAHSPHQ